MSAKRVCAGHKCPNRTDGPTYCPACAAARERRRGTRQARGYGKQHTATRAEWQTVLDSGARVMCWRAIHPDLARYPCLQPTVPIDPCDWHLGHDDTDRRLTRGPEHPACNDTAAARSSHGQ